MYGYLIVASCAWTMMIVHRQHLLLVLETKVEATQHYFTKGALGHDAPKSSQPRRREVVTYLQGRSSPVMCINTKVRIPESYSDDDAIELTESSELWQRWTHASWPLSFSSSHESRLATKPSTDLSNTTASFPVLYSQLCRPDTWSAYAPSLQQQH